MIEGDRADERAETLEAIYATGLRLLARREHSTRELKLKLLQRGFEAAEIDPVLERLRDENALSEARFAEEFVRVRSRQGYGPVRIQAELRERGVDSALAEPFLDGEDWDCIAREQQRRRFGAPPRGVAERGKQYRFLSNRGFTAEQIRRAMDS